MHPRMLAVLLIASLASPAAAHAPVPFKEAFKGPTLKDLSTRKGMELYFDNYRKNVSDFINKVTKRSPKALIRQGAQRLLDASSSDKLRKNGQRKGSVMPRSLDKVLQYTAADPHLGNVLKHSQTNGHYYVMSDLHMGVGRVDGGGWDPQEDFKRGDVFARTMDHISHRPGNNTLVVGGDFIDILEHVDPQASMKDLKSGISAIVGGHMQEFAALAKAVVKDGLHVVYLRGNHDIRLVDSSEIATKKTTVRAHFISEIMKAAGLDATEQKTFKQRVAFAGHMAPLGKFGELLVTHGDAIDPTNSWGSQIDPFSTTVDGSRVIKDNFGDNVVKRIWDRIEKKDGDADNGTSSATKKVAMNLIKNPKMWGKAAGLLWRMTRSRFETSPAQDLAEKIEARRALLHWVKQSGFAEMMNAPLIENGEKPLPAQQYVKKLEAVYAEQPKALQERMTANTRVGNFGRLAIGAAKVGKDTTNGEVTYLNLMTKAFPNAKHFVSGHDHEERIRTGKIKGGVSFLDSGTWTKIDREWRMNVVVAHTGADGKILEGEDRPNLFRTNETTGAPNLENNAKAPLELVPGWQ